MTLTGSTWVKNGRKHNKTTQKKKEEKQNENPFEKSKTHYGENSMWDFRLNSLAHRMDKQIDRQSDCGVASATAAAAAQDETE